MKYLIGFVILGICLCKADADEEFQKAFLGAAEACKTDIGASQADIDDMIAKRPPAGRAGKCIRGCILQTFGLMDADGNLVKEVALGHFKKLSGDDSAKMKIAAEILDDCATKKVAGDPCESAVVYKDCMKNGAKTNGIEDDM